MNPSSYEETVTKVNMEILLLRKDLKRVGHPGIKRQVENEILQKENRLRLLMKKHINGGLIQTPAIQPSSEKETPPCQIRKVPRKSESK